MCILIGNQYSAFDSGRNIFHEEGFVFVDTKMEADEVICDMADTKLCFMMYRIKEDTVIVDNIFHE